MIRCYVWSSEERFYLNAKKLWKRRNSSRVSERTLDEWNFDQNTFPVKSIYHFKKKKKTYRFKTNAYDSLVRRWERSRPIGKVHEWIMRRRRVDVASFVFVSNVTSHLDFSAEMPLSASSCMQTSRLFLTAKISWRDRQPIDINRSSLHIKTRLDSIRQRYKDMKIFSSFSLHANWNK